MSTTAVRTSTTSPEPTRVSTLRRGLRAIGAQNLSLVAAIVAVMLFIGSQNSAFYLTSNLKTIGMAVTISGLLAIVQTVVIVMGGIDLSVGSVAGLASVSSAMLFTHFGAGVSILGALAIGAVCGVVSGCIVVFGRVTPMIATLAGLIAFKGVAQLISDGRAQGYTGADNVYIFLARGSMIGIPTLVWVLAVVAMAVHVLLRYTRVGRNIYAVGGNDTAARLSGVNINRYIIGVFVLAGAVAALAGVLITARTGSGQPISGSEGLEFQSITAAALGGVALRGGKGTIGGTILAVVLLGVLLNGMSLLGVNPFWQNVAQGSLLIAAVVIQQLRNGERRVGLPK
ncbi:ABC transporter permease [Xylanimonas ulmi]|uniref:Monosaccharide ABC transporter membrane protein (CUT2 family) n=1 Tax=Xylanimonas ulmi TaxID=228973 RepID=A0A4Q7M454_9MICO|nr:ABC transporter permease [Xylanibacterium ulmi]RZS60759.1 monosaccharide ABC transporter membrane protein (CUT2 family) [Xylanibacterium ulmi]